MVYILQLNYASLVANDSSVENFLYTCVCREYVLYAQLQETMVDELLQVINKPNLIMIAGVLH